jgi:hypothetical protein
MASKIELKKFRHDISTLKKRGLISGIDARSAKPTKNLRRTIAKYDDVLSGKATAVKLSKKGLREYKELGKPFDIAKPKGLPQRVIVPHSAGERVTVSHGKVHVTNPAGIHRTILPVKFQNLEQYLSDLSKSQVKLAPGERFAFRFFGNHSLRTFRSMDQLIDYINHYESVFDAIDEDNSEAMNDIYQNLEIVKVDQPKLSDWERGSKSQQRKREGFTNWKQHYQQRKRDLKEAPKYKQSQYLAQQAQRAREYRARMSQAERAKYNTAGRKRAKKSNRKSKKN